MILWGPFTPHFLEMEGKQDQGESWLPKYSARCTFSKQVQSSLHTAQRLFFGKYSNALGTVINPLPDRHPTFGTEEQGSSSQGRSQHARGAPGFLYYPSQCQLTQVSQKPATCHRLL